ncbi:MAG TPA: hypothetical protein VLA56_22345 [Pseudomonadales bacterium]|nr:hypothetical protein [Pseudomonadales bacterium]
MVAMKDFLQTTIIGGMVFLAPAPVSVGDGWQLGDPLEPVQAGWIAVFVPQAPTPMVDDIVYMPAARIRPANAPSGEV